MEIKTKVCTKCGEEKELNTDNWYRGHNKSGVHSWCKVCVRTNSTNKRRADPNAFKRYYAEYYATHKAMRREYNAKYRATNKETLREYGAKQHRQYITELADPYLVRLLHKQGFFVITPELIELKRQQMLAKRLLKQLKQWREANESNSANVQG